MGNDEKDSRNKTYVHLEGLNTTLNKYGKGSKNIDLSCSQNMAMMKKSIKTKHGYNCAIMEWAAKTNNRYTMNTTHGNDGKGGRNTT